MNQAQITAQIEANSNNAEFIDGMLKGIEAFHNNERHDTGAMSADFYAGYSLAVKVPFDVECQLNDILEAEEL